MVSFSYLYTITATALIVTSTLTCNSILARIKLHLPDNIYLQIYRCALYKTCLQIFTWIILWTWFNPFMGTGAGQSPLPVGRTAIFAQLGNKWVKEVYLCLLSKWNKTDSYDMFVSCYWQERCVKVFMIDMCFLERNCICVFPYP